MTDHQTGLQWEQKTTTVGSGVDLGDAHDVDNYYTWNTTFGGTTPNGTVFTDFLNKLNGGLGPNTCFAGPCDWRLPTVEELQTILLDPYPCGTSPCIDPVFGPTVLSFYWSATTDAADPTDAWGVGFLDGNVLSPSKTSSGYVRAVRTGS